MKKIIYLENFKTFKEHCLTNQIHEKVLEGFEKNGINKNNNKSEIVSWKNSFPQVNNLLISLNTRDDVYIGLEYKIPLNSRGIIDLIIFSKGKNNEENVSIIELKQWDYVEKSNLLNYIQTYLKGKLTTIKHPSIQALSYKYTLEDFYEAVRENSINVYSSAYLHNMPRNNNESILNIKYNITDLAPIFYREDFNSLQKWLKNKISKGEGKEVAQKITNSKFSPSKSVQLMYSEILSNKANFHLLSEQLEIFSQIISSLHKKQLFFVEGKPGTGKTILAAHILNHSLHSNLNACILTTNKQLNESILNSLVIDDPKKMTRLSNLMTTTYKFLNSDQDYDLIIIDEAQSIKPWSQRGISSKEILEKILSRGKNVIFLYDKLQKASNSEIGIDEIYKISSEFNLKEKKFIPELFNAELKIVLRSRASNLFINWIEYLFDKTNIKPTNLPSEFDFKLFDNPNKMWEHTMSKNINNNARVLSTFSWKWKSQYDDLDNLTDDIVIDEFNFKKPWNSSKIINWLTNPISFNQVGSMHTTRGQELDYSGVIIGKSLKYRDGKIIVDWKNWFGSSKNGLKNNPEKWFDLLYNEIYILMTRARKGVYIFVEDENLRNYLKSKF